MVIPSGAALRVAVIWDANLGLRLRAAQEFGLVDHRDAQRFRLLELRAGIGARRSDPPDLSNLGRRCLLEALHPSEVARQQPRSLGADVANAEGEEQRGQGSLL